MQTLESNLGWILIIAVTFAVFLYKYFTKDKDAITSKFIAKKNLASDFSTTLPLIQQALLNAKFTNIGFDEAENRFYATSGFLMSSWSEYIEVKIIKMDQRTELNFKSICAFPLQIVDWGKNKENYRKFEKELNKLTTDSSEARTALA